MPRLLIFAAGLVISASLWHLPNATAGELLTNGGFESGTDDWTASFGQLTTVDAPVHSGSNAAGLASTALQSHEVYQFLSIQASTPYEFSAWIFLDDTDVQRTFLRISWYAGDGSLVSTADSQMLTIPESDYRFVSTGSVPAPDRARTARVGIWVQASGAFTLYADDASFIGQAAATATDTPAPIAATASPTPVPPAQTPPPTPRPGQTAPASPTPGQSRGSRPTDPTEPVQTVFPELANGGFEQVQPDGTPFAWRDIGADLACVTERFIEGARSLHIVSRTSSTKWAYQTVVVEPGATYEAATYAMTIDASEAFLRLTWYSTPDGGGPAIDSSDSLDSVEPGPGVFTQITTGPVQAPTDAHTVKVKLMLRPGSEAERSAYFDQVEFSASSAQPAGERSGPALGGQRAARLAANPVAGAVRGVEAGPSTPVGLANVTPMPRGAAAAQARASGASSWLVWPALISGGLALSIGVGGEVLRRRRRQTQDAGQH